LGLKSRLESKTGLAIVLIYYQRLGICYGFLKAPREARPIDTSNGSKEAVK
jgi:hypothetical protein